MCISPRERDTFQTAPVSMGTGEGDPQKDSHSVSLSATPQNGGPSDPADRHLRYSMKCSTQSDTYCPKGASEPCVTMRHSDTTYFCSATLTGTGGQGGEGEK